MGKGVVNLNRKSSIRIKQPVSAYKRLYALALTVVAKMTGNLAFPTPVPALTDITTLATALKNSMANLGHKRNRAAKAQLIQCQSDFKALWSAMQALKADILNTVLINNPNDVFAQRNQLVSTGFGMKLLSKKTSIPWATVRNLQQSNTKAHPFNMHRISWERPTGQIKGKRAASYLITDATTGELLGQTPFTNFEVPITGTTQRVVMVTPFNANTYGIGSKITVK